MLSDEKWLCSYHWQYSSSLPTWAETQHTLALNFTFPNSTKNAVKNDGKRHSCANVLLLSTAACSGWESCSDLQS